LHARINFAFGESENKQTSICGAKNRNLSLSSEEREKRKRALRSRARTSTTKVKLQNTLQGWIGRTLLFCLLFMPRGVTKEAVNSGNKSIAATRARTPLGDLITDKFPNYR
jgi:hypothetical protein